MINREKVKQSDFQLPIPNKYFRFVIYTQKCINQSKHFLYVSFLINCPIFLYSDGLGLKNILFDLI